MASQVNSTYTKQMVIVNLRETTQPMVKKIIKPYIHWGNQHFLGQRAFNRASIKGLYFCIKVRVRHYIVKEDKKFTLIKFNNAGTQYQINSGI